MTRDNIPNIQKLAARTSSLVLDLLLTSNLVAEENSDSATALAEKRFLLFRADSAHSFAADAPKESNQLAELMIEDLINAGFVNEVDRDSACEIAADEILVQYAFMET